MTINLLLDHLSKSVLSHVFLCIPETYMLNEQSCSDMVLTPTPPEGPGYCVAQADGHTATGSSRGKGGLAGLQLVWTSCCEVVMFGRYIITAHLSL